MVDRNASLLVHGPTRRQLFCNAAAVAGIALIPVAVAGTAADDGISHSAEAIHQEPVFKATPRQVYEALTDAKQFDHVQRLSKAVTSMEVGSKPAEIAPEVGGAFTLFGGYITGRHLELLPDKRIVQAWRSQGWQEGDYSIVRFELVEQGAETKIVLNHRGFPQGNAQHLAAGWKSNYWGPLEKFLAKG
jgi:activator of HSP90 ATPase